MNQAFTFYPSFYDAIKDLDDNDRLAVYDAICMYGVTGKIPKAKGVASTVFKLLRPVIDTNVSRRNAGNKGGKASSKTEANVKQTVSKQQANVKQTLTEKEIEIEKEIEKEKEKEIEKEHECVSNTRARTREDNTHTHTPDEPIRIPTINAVADENAEKGYGLTFESLQEFMEYNKNRGWRMNWQQALKKWAEREKKPPKVQKKNAFTGFENQHSYDFDALKDVLGVPAGGAT